MATAAGMTEAVLYETLVNYLVSMARTVEGAMNRALEAIVGVTDSRTFSLPGEVFLLEPRINEMEIIIDEHAIRLLRRGSFSDDEVRLIVASLKITNDLERIGDLAVNLAECVISLREMPAAQLPQELAPMTSAVRAMVSKSLGRSDFPQRRNGRAGSSKRRCRRSIPRSHLRSAHAKHDPASSSRQPGNAVHSCHQTP